MTCMASFIELIPLTFAIAAYRKKGLESNLYTAFLPRSLPFQGSFAAIPLQKQGVMV